MCKVLHMKNTIIIISLFIFCDIKIIFGLPNFGELPGQITYPDDACSIELSKDELFHRKNLNIAYFGKRLPDYKCYYNIVKKNIVYMVNLEYVVIDDYFSTDYPDIFKYFYNIKELSIRFDFIRLLPIELSHFSKLEKLRIVMKLDNLPQWFTNLNHLQYLNLYGSSFNHLDGNILLNTNINHLVIDIKYYNSLPINFCNNLSRKIEFRVPPLFNKKEKKKLKKYFPNCKISFSESIF